MELLLICSMVKEASEASSNSDCRTPNLVLELALKPWIPACTSFDLHYSLAFCRSSPSYLVLSPLFELGLQQGSLGVLGV